MRCKLIKVGADGSEGPPNIRDVEAAVEHHEPLRYGETFEDACDRVEREIIAMGRAWIGAGPDSLFLLTPVRQTLCMECANAADLASFKAGEHRRMATYLNGDGSVVTSFGGAVLGRVVRETVRKMLTPSARYDATYLVVDGVDGRSYYGRGVGRGMYVRLHPYAS